MDGTYTPLPILLGGMVTILARRHDLHEDNRMWMLMDQHYLYLINWLRADYQRFHWFIDSKLSIDLPNPFLTLILLDQPHYFLSIVNQNLPRTVPQRTYFRRSQEASLSGPPPPADNEAIMVSLRRLEFGQTVMGSRLTTMEIDYCISMFPIYDHFAQQRVIAPEGPHPSWYNYPDQGFSDHGGSADDQQLWGFIPFPRRNEEIAEFCVKGDILVHMKYRSFSFQLIHGNNSFSGLFLPASRLSSVTAYRSRYTAFYHKDEFSCWRSPMFQFILWNTDHNMGTCNFAGSLWKNRRR